MPGDVAVLAGLRQPDQRSCGAASLVAARMLVDPAYAALVSPAGGPSRYADEVLGMHRRITGPVAATGALQIPWPRVIGTPPWTVANQMSSLTAPGLAPVHYSVRQAVVDRDGAAQAALAVVEARPVPIYVGDRWLPRHVVLAVGRRADLAPGGAGFVAGFDVYDPARGAVVPVTLTAFVDAGLDLGGWSHPWAVVLPDHA